MTPMDDRTRRMTAKSMRAALWYVLFMAILSVALGFAVTSLMERGNPAAGVAWIILSCLLFIAFAFLGLIYLIEFFHTRAQGGIRVLWRNYALRLLLSLTSLIGPFWMLTPHPGLAQRPATLEVVNILVAAFSIGLLLWAFSIKLPVPVLSEIVAGEGPNDTADPTSRP